MITEQKTKFIELRAKGLSLSSIATELSVCKRTLINWGHKLEAEIQDLQNAEQEALQEQILGLREQRLRRQGELLAQVEAELQKRSLADLSTARLFSMAESLRKQILKETTPSRQSRSGKERLLPSPDLALPPVDDRCNNGAIPVQPERASNPPIAIDPSIRSEITDMQDSQLKVLSTNDSIQPTSGGGGSRRSSEASRKGGPASPNVSPTSSGDRCNNGATSVQPPSDPTPEHSGREVQNHQQSTITHQPNEGAVSVQSSFDIASKYLTNDTDHEIFDAPVGGNPEEPFIQVTLQDVMDKLPENMRQRISEMRHPNELKRWLREHGGYVASLFNNTSQ